MDQLRNHHGHHQAQAGQSQKRITKAKEPMIKYISSPMMVQAGSASEFRAIVQQLTGQNSDFATYHEEEEGAHREQVSWGSSNHEASKAEVIRFSEEAVPPADRDRLVDENNLWEAVAESLSAYQSPFVYV